MLTREEFTLLVAALVRTASETHGPPWGEGEVLDCYAKTTRAVGLAAADPLGKLSFAPDGSGLL